MKGYGLGQVFLDWKRVPVCHLCAWGTLGDETHLVLECPQSQLPSEQWSHMFAGPQTMQGFMWQDDLIGVVKFVNAYIIKMDPSPQAEASDQPCVVGRDVI